MYELFDIFARGGGGGSGGGGGGGSGGSGGSIIVLIGFLPSYFLARFIHSKMNNWIGAVISIAFSLAYGALWLLWGFIGIWFFLASVYGGVEGFFNLGGRAIRLARKAAKKQLEVAASKDPVWNAQALHEYVGQVFMAFQADWSTFNTERMKTYLTPAYAQHMQLVLAALRLRQRRNSVEQPELLDYYPIAVRDALDDAFDSVTFYIRARAHDRTLETIDGQEHELFVDNNEFQEYWRFVRSGQTWLLAGIDQATADSAAGSQSIRAFAAQNQLFYSLDWGWLLLPRRGQLFGAGRFGSSDINNHVIGIYHNLLIELYTYIPSPQSDGTYDKQYTIAQVALPKRYDSLIVEAKGSRLENMFRRTPRGYNKLSLEWTEFNKRYRVFATDVEQVTAFELLHPVYMEKLFALPFKVSIEVVDNVVYLYTKDKKADYPTMYSILQDAFKEMRL